MTNKQPVYGVMAAWDNPHDLLQAAHQASEDGYSHMDAYTPFPIEGLDEAIGCHPTRLPLLVLIGGLVGGFGGFFMQYWATSHAYRIVAGGKPLNSWPAYMPITFELTVLCAALTAVIGMIVLNGLPHPYHPVFNAPGFERATRNRFFLCIESTDPRFDRVSSRQYLETLDPEQVTEVAW